MKKLALAALALASLAFFGGSAKADHRAGGRVYTPGYGYYPRTTGLGYYGGRSFTNPHYGFTPTYGAPRIGLYSYSPIGGSRYGNFNRGYSNFNRGYGYGGGYGRGYGRSGFGIGVSNRGVSFYYRR